MNQKKIIFLFLLFAGVFLVLFLVSAGASGPFPPQDKSLIKAETDAKVYLFQNEKLYWIENEETFNSMSEIWNWEDIVVYSDAVFVSILGMYKQGPKFLSDGLLLRTQDDSSVYLIENNKKRAFFNEDAFLSRGYDWNDVIFVTQAVLDYYSEGEVICPQGVNCVESFEQTCRDECVSGKKRCSEGYLQTCGTYDGDACFEWPESTRGRGNEFCQFGCYNSLCTNEINTSLVYPIGKDPLKKPSENGFSITQAFREYNDKIGGNHTGVDLARLCNSKDPVRAISDGIVFKSNVDCSRGKGWGTYVIIKHEISGNLVYSQYAHLNCSNLKVKDNDTVKAGQIIGYIGNTGFAYGKNCVEGYHLHFELKKKSDPGPGYIADGSTTYTFDDYYDPLEFIKTFMTCKDVSCIDISELDRQVDRQVDNKTSELGEIINRRLQHRTIYPPYLLDDSASSLWMKFTDLVKGSDRTFLYDAYYNDGVAFDLLRFKALKNAQYFFNQGDAINARKYLDHSYKYESMSSMSFSAASEVFMNNLDKAEELAQKISDYSKTFVKIGISAYAPGASMAATFLYAGVDYAADRAVYGEGQAFENAVDEATVELIVWGIFNRVPMPNTGGKTLSQYLENRVGKISFPMIQDAFKSEEVQFAVSKVVKEAVGEVSEEGIETFLRYLRDELTKGFANQRIDVHSPVELRVYDSEGRFTGLKDGVVRHDITRSVYNNGSVTLYFPEDVFEYEVKGTDNGKYDLIITSNNNGESSTFSALEIPVYEDTTHRYVINLEKFFSDQVELFLGEDVLENQCGDGVRQEGEECDDGNVFNGDGCSEFCNQETLRSDGGEKMFWMNPNMNKPDTNQHDVAINNIGNIVAVWTEVDQITNPGTYWGEHILAQRFDKLGNKVGNEFQVNLDYEGSVQVRDPKVAFLSDGRFVVVWKSDSAVEHNIYAQIFNIDGTRVGNKIKVTNHIGYTNYEKYEPRIDTSGKGHFVVTWMMDNYIWSQVFDKEGNRRENKGHNEHYGFGVPGEYHGTLGAYDVAMSENGDIVVIYKIETILGEEKYAASFFDVNGNRRRPDIEIEPKCYQPSGPRAGIDDEGNFWFSYRCSPSNDEVLIDKDFELYAQHFDKNGNKIGETIRVNSPLEDRQEMPTITVDKDGNLFVAWQDESYRVDGNQKRRADDIFFTWLNREGEKIISDTQLNFYKERAQKNPVIATNGRGRYVFMWMSFVAQPEAYEQYGYYIKPYQLNQCDVDSDCSDEVFRNGEERCDGGICVREEPLCQFSMADDECNFKLCCGLECELYKMPDETSCSNDDDFCTLNDMCVGGECVSSGEKKQCDDDNVCTRGSCNPDTGDCIYEFVEGKCDDNDEDTMNDTCQDGKCVGERIGTLAEVPTELEPDCDDGNMCTEDSYNIFGCANEPFTGGQISCGLGVCQHMVIECADGVLQECDPFEGAREELCDSLDNDCDGEVDEDDVCAIDPDINGDGVFNVDDVLLLNLYLYWNGPAPEPLERADFNSDGEVTTADVVEQLNQLVEQGVSQTTNGGLSLPRWLQAFYVPAYPKTTDEVSIVVVIKGPCWGCTVTIPDRSDGSVHTFPIPDLQKNEEYTLILEEGHLPIGPHEYEPFISGQTTREQKYWRQGLYFEVAP